MNLQDNAVLPLWQPVGHSTYKITKNVAKKLNTLATHTGTLDPMAEGVIIVLTGDRRFEKHKHTDVKKTYEFEIILGIKTDTYDGMGLITKLNLKKEIPMKDAYKDLVGDYKQTVPLYSVAKVDGKSMFEHSRAGNLPKNIPTKSGQIYELELFNENKISLKIAVENIVTRIKLVQGDFRQEEIIKNWEDFIAKNPNLELQKLKFTATVSKGLYIRSLSQDICNIYGTCGFVYKLVRIKNGKYSKKDCIKI